MVIFSRIEQPRVATIAILSPFSTYFLQVLIQVGNFRKSLFCRFSIEGLIRNFFPYFSLFSGDPSEPGAALSEAWEDAGGTAVHYDVRPRQLLALVHPCQRASHRSQRARRSILLAYLA